MSEKPQMDDETLGVVVSELDHDLRCMEGDTGMERIRWNNRAMLMAVNRIEALKSEVERLGGDMPDRLVELATRNAERKMGIAASWHNRPSCPGRWVLNSEVTGIVIWNVSDSDFADSCKLEEVGGRWFGPIPHDHK